MFEKFKEQLNRIFPKANFSAETTEHEVDAFLETVNADQANELQGQLDQANSDLETANNKITEQETKLTEMETSNEEALTNLRNELTADFDSKLTAEVDGLKALINSEVETATNLANEAVESAKSELTEKSNNAITEALEMPNSKISEVAQEIAKIKGIAAGGNSTSAESAGTEKPTEKKSNVTKLETGKLGRLGL